MGKSQGSMGHYRACANGRYQAILILPRGLGTRLPIVGNRWGLREGAHPQKELDCSSETCGKLVGTKVGLPWSGGWSWVTRLDFARKSWGWVPPLTGDFRMRILGGLCQKESCMVYTEIRNQAENSCVCPYTDLNPVHVNHHLGNSYILYWTPCESLINFTLKRKLWKR